MPEPPPRQDPPPTLEYPSDATLRSIRRGVRLIILLTLLNTVMLGASVAAPGLSAFVKSQWTSYQAAKAERARAAQAKAALAALAKAQAACLAFEQPPDTLLLADDFAAGTLPLRGATAATSPGTRRAVDEASTPGAAPLPACFRGMPSNLPGFGLIIDDREVYPFVHARRWMPGAAEQLVLFSVSIEPGADHVRRLLALAIDPATETDGMKFDRYASWELLIPDARPRKPLRIYAGRPDPGDESQWAVPYEWGDGRGTFTGRLSPGRGFELRVDGPLAPFLRRRNSG